MQEPNEIDNPSSGGKLKPVTGKRWQTLWHNHEIVVEQKLNLRLVEEESLIIDGVVQQSRYKPATMMSDLYGKVEENGRIYEVRAHLGSTDYGMKVGCHIFVEEELVGGDIDKKLLF